MWRSGHLYVAVKVVQQRFVIVAAPGAHLTSLFGPMPLAERQPVVYLLIHRGKDELGRAVVRRRAPGLPRRRHRNRGACRPPPPQIADRGCPHPL
jgi:hypothetical protein